MNEITKSEYPCIPLNKDYEYYQGDSPDFVCSRCEYRENLYDFIQKQYNHFALLMCCEKNPKSEPHPEAIFVDKNNTENTLAIEVKSINKFYHTNERKNDFMAGQHHSFDNRHLDEIGSVLLCALNNVLTSENHNMKKSILYYSFLREHTHVHFNYDTKNKCTFKDIFLKVEKKEVKKIYEQLFNCFTEFYKSIICLLSNKIGETNMSWDLLWEIKEVQYEFSVTVYFTDEPSAITWSDFNPYAEWRPNKEILSQRIICFFQECEKKFLDFPNSRHILLLKNESRYFTGDVLKILNQLKKPDYIDEVWLSEYEYEEIYDDEGELLGEKKIDIHYHKIV